MLIIYRKTMFIKGFLSIDVKDYLIYIESIFDTYMEIILNTLPFNKV